MEYLKEENYRRFGLDFKIILIGNASTGKTSIINRYLKNIFNEQICATIAPDLSFKAIKKDKTLYRIQFWDIPGQEHVPIITRMFCNNSDGIVFCCEVLIKNH